MENTISSAAPDRVVPHSRFDLTAVEPRAYAGLLLMHKQLSQSGLSLTHWDLINVRTSQLNGCAFCLLQHSQEAIEHGETEQRLHALPAWREAPYFTAEERAILAFTEEVTLIARHHVADAVYAEAVALLGEAYLAQVLLAVVAMNAWNRLGIAQRKVPA
ncbi:carboxymuconolactone decarboxylase family protein [Hymenobacter ruricola]|uniref:Carboxymuconolactone decarboxylase family protein n=1 Tax=Hymenobacter ruricola TaxID=2791023 RepID=A0ABS0I3C1_9BACT|nr:carboxymuconolactone decarboxylase family protein [Hymenobacter ruricola]MBF9221286.1 carboxymuconolactone decarboxylase family protein [Hymenobacter ruricola]